MSLKTGYFTIIDKFDSGVVVYEQDKKYYLKLSDQSSSGDDLVIPRKIYEGLILASKLQSYKKGKRS